MIIEELEIPDVKIIKPKKIGDERGYFSEVYNKKNLFEAGIDLDFVQDNHSLSVESGVIRGIHYQLPPFAQDKLLRVVSGAVLDVAVDLRKESATFGKYVTAEISADEWNQILVPAGFGHAVVTLLPNTQLSYKVTSYYAPEHDRGIIWNDPDLGISWPFPEEQLILSEKDRNLPTLKMALEELGC